MCDPRVRISKDWRERSSKKGGGLAERHGSHGADTDSASSACFAWQSGSGVASDFDTICTK